MKTYFTDINGNQIVIGQDDPLTQADYEVAVQNILDTTAKSKGYNDIVSACSYAGYTNAFQAEAIALGTWRSNVWSTCYTILNQVTSGTITQPTIDELLAQIPKFTGA